MAKTSAGIIAYRFAGNELQVLLVHPGGPFWKNKDEGAWSIPKGEYDAGEDPMLVAIREFEEETGNVIVSKKYCELTPVWMKSGKTVRAWAVEADFEEVFISSNMFEMEWPPRSGKMQSFPEVDRAEWMNLQQAKTKINPAQLPLVLELHEILTKQK